MPVEDQLAEVRDGIVLAADVLDGRGNVLLASGTRLTRAHLQILERRGLRAVTVTTPEDRARAEQGAPGAADPAVIAEMLARQERTFAKVRGQALMETIYRAARAHLERGNLPPG